MADSPLTFGKDPAGAPVAALVDTDGTARVVRTPLAYEIYRGDASAMPANVILNIDPTSATFRGRHRIEIRVDTENTVLSRALRMDLTLGSQPSDTARRFENVIAEGAKGTALITPLPAPPGGAEATATFRHIQAPQFDSFAMTQRLVFNLQGAAAISGKLRIMAYLS